MSFRFFDPVTGVWSIHLGRQPPQRSARCARLRDPSRGSTWVCSKGPTPSPAYRSSSGSCGRASTLQRRGGSSRSRTTAARPGSRTGLTSSRGRGTTRERGNRPRGVVHLARARLRLPRWGCGTCTTAGCGSDSRAATSGTSSSRRASRARCSTVLGTWTRSRLIMTAGWWQSNRSLDPVTRLWAIYWASNRTALGLPEQPVVGSFEDGVGTFDCDDTFAGSRSSFATAGGTCPSTCHIPAGRSSSRTTAARPGRRTTNTPSPWTGGCCMQRAQEHRRRTQRLLPHHEGCLSRGAVRHRADGAQVVRHRSGRSSGPPGGPRARAFGRETTGAVLGQLRIAGDLGFVILDLSGESFYFLLISTWRNENELWETVWAKTGPDDPLFQSVAARRHALSGFLRLGARAASHERVAWATTSARIATRSAPQRTSPTRSRARCSPAPLTWCG